MFCCIVENKILSLSLQNLHNTAHLTLGTLLQYLGKSKIQISVDIQPIWKKMQINCILIASNFVIRPQILIFSVLKNGVSFPMLIANKIFHADFRRYRRLQLPGNPMPPGV